MASADHDGQDDTMAAVFAHKAALRKSMLRTLRALPEAQLASQSKAVAQILFEQPFFRKARSIGCYLSMAKGELRTDEIVSHILAQRDAALYTPYLPPASYTETPLMHMLRLYSTRDLENCPLDRWGILDPGPHRRDKDAETIEAREDVMSADAPTLDVILIPGVAFDADCNRLGRGKAFYDRFLTTYSEVVGKPLLVALALSPQVVDEPVPVTTADFTLDAVISPGGIVWREGAQPKTE